MLLWDNVEINKIISAYLLLFLRLRQVYKKCIDFTFSIILIKYNSTSLISENIYRIEKKNVCFSKIPQPLFILKKYNSYIFHIFHIFIYFFELRQVKKGPSHSFSPFISHIVKLNFEIWFAIEKNAYFKDIKIKKQVF